MDTHEIRTVTAPDGSTVTELVRPERQGSRSLSLARAVIAPGRQTLAHHHRSSEEIYYVLSGEGVVTVSGRRHPLVPGAAVLIPAGSEHSARCVGPEPLVLLCCCSPPYHDEDTVLTEPVGV